MGHVEQRDWPVGLRGKGMAAVAFQANGTIILQEEYSAMERAFAGRARLVVT